MEKMPLQVLVRLWVMVFINYYIWSCWYVTMNQYLTTSLGFTGTQVGLAYGTTAIGAIVSPFFAGIVADRFMPTERLLGILHLLGAALLYYVSTQSEFVIFYPALMAYTISYMAGLGLTNTLALAHVKNPAKEFPLVMMMGSVGWIAAGITISGLQIGDSAWMFRLASGAALVMGLYSFTLPHTPAKGATEKLSIGRLLGFDALSLLRDRSFAVFMICSLLICIPLSFYFSWMYTFLNEMRVTNGAAKMTIGQVSDVVFLLLLPMMLLQFGSKGILLIGMAAWTLRFGLFTWFAKNPSHHSAMYLGIAVHGMCYDFIFVMGRMYVDKRASEKIRGAAQGLHALVTLGIGMFIGSWLSGIVVEYFAIKGETTTYNWMAIWLIPAVLSLILMVLFAILFNDQPAINSPADAQESS